MITKSARGMFHVQWGVNFRCGFHLKKGNFYFDAKKKHFHFKDDPYLKLTPTVENYLLCHFQFEII